MAMHVYTPILGKRIRVTQTDSCGVVDTEAGLSVVTDGFVTVTLSAEVEDGVEIFQRKANGTVCVNEKFAPSFKWFNVEIELCGVNPGLLALTTNAEVYNNGSDPIGVTVAEGTIEKYFAFELWTGLAGSQCGGTSTDEASGYMLLPLVRAGTFGDLTVDGENAATFSVTNATTKGGNSWGTGPFNVVKGTDGVASKLPTALDPLDHFLLIDTALTPPPSADDYTPISS